MTWREKTIATILLLIARMLADDPAIAADLKTLATHISVYGPKNDPTLKLEEAK